MTLLEMSVVYAEHASRLHQMLVWLNGRAADL